MTLLLATRLHMTMQVHVAYVYRLLPAPPPCSLSLALPFSLSPFLSRAQTLTHSHSSLAIRCAILLDELDDYRGLRKGRAMGHIVVETRTHNAVPLLRFSCSRRVIALPTGLLNMHRVRHVCACL